MNINNGIRQLKAACANVTPLKVLKVTLILLPSIAGLTGEAMAGAPAGTINLDEGAKAFITPVITFITAWAPTFIFAGGTIGAIAAPGDLRVKFGGALGGMAVAGLGVFAAKKMLGVAD